MSFNKSLITSLLCQFYLGFLKFLLRTSWYMYEKQIAFIWKQANKMIFLGALNICTLVHYGPYFCAAMNHCQIKQSLMIYYTWLLNLENSTCIDTPKHGQQRITFNLSASSLYGNWKYDWICEQYPKRCYNLNCLSFHLHEDHIANLTFIFKYFNLIFQSSSTMSICCMTLVSSILFFKNPIFIFHFIFIFIVCDIRNMLIHYLKDYIINNLYSKFIYILCEENSLLIFNKIYRNWDIFLLHNKMPYQVNNQWEVLYLRGTYVHDVCVILS